MSSVLPSKTFGNVTTKSSAMGLAKKSAFSIIIVGEDFESFVELIDFFYGTSCQSIVGEGVVKVHFQAARNRSKAGIRVAARLSGVELKYCRSWF